MPKVDIDINAKDKASPKIKGVTGAMVAANLATKAGIEGRKFTIQAPLLTLTKAQIIQKGVALGVDYSLTHSCYDPSTDGKACGYCDSCLLRKKGFQEAGVEDPTIYAI